MLRAVRVLEGGRGGNFFPNSRELMHISFYLKHFCYYVLLVPGKNPTSYEHRALLPQNSHGRQLNVISQLSRYFLQQFNRP